MKEDKSNLISHNKTTRHFKDTYIEVKNKIMKKGELPHASVELQLDLLDQLSEFAFGRFLLEHKGWNGYWTHYAIMHQYKGRITGKNADNNTFAPLEGFILNRAPVVLAHNRDIFILKILYKKKQEATTLLHLFHAA
jgi:hypothetical protein